MRRHVIAHRGGVVDQQYLNETHEPHAFLGRRLVISADEVEQLAELVLRIGAAFTAQLDDRAHAAGKTAHGGRARRVYI